MEFDTKKEMEELEERKTGSEEVYSGNLLHVFRDTVVLPSGYPSAREYIRHNGAVAIVPLTERGTVIAERQFRYPFGEVVTEIPAGKLDWAGEDRLEAAKRELREETGYSAGRWTYLGAIRPSVAYTTEKIWIYLAEDLERGERELDEDEFLSVVEIPLPEFVAMVMNGEVEDSKTQSAILMTARMKGI